MSNVARIPPVRVGEPLGIGAAARAKTSRRSGRRLRSASAFVAPKARRSRISAIMSG